MRVEILANDRASFIKPMAEGLARMLRDCGAEPRIHYDGLSALMRRQKLDFSSARSLAGSTLRLAQSRSAFEEFSARLDGTDLIVIVANMPGSFSPVSCPMWSCFGAGFPTCPSSTTISTICRRSTAGAGSHVSIFSRIVGSIRVADL